MVKVHDVGVRTLILLQVLSTLGSDQPEAPEDIISFEGGNDIIECTTLPSRKDERKKNKTETVAQAMLYVLNIICLSILLITFHS